MTREQAYATYDQATEYVEYYSGQWLVVPFAPVTQPEFFTCHPRRAR